MARPTLIIRGTGARSWDDTRRVLAAVASVLVDRPVSWRDAGPQRWRDGNVSLEVQRSFDPFCFPKDPGGMVFTIRLAIDERVVLSEWPANEERPHEPLTLPLDVDLATFARVHQAVEALLYTLVAERADLPLSLSTA